MARQNKITISFSKEYQDVYQVLKNKGNVSRYVCELVRQSLKQDNFEERIEKIVKKMLCQNPDIKQDDLQKAADSFDF